MMGKGRTDADWWRLFPGRHAAELAAFSQHAASVTTLVERDGILILEVHWRPLPGVESLRLHVGFSPLHPFCRPDVAAPDIKLERHQNPLSHGLCLLTQESGQWYPHQLVADFIAERLPKVFEAVQLRQEGRWEEAAAVEERAPDPLSPYYSHQAEEHSAVIYSDEQMKPDAAVGVLRFLIQPRADGSQFPPFQALLQKVEPLSGKWLAKPFELPKRIGAWQKITGRWVRLRPPFPESPQALLEAAEHEIARQAGLRPAEQETLKSIGDAQFSITGVLFEEERDYGPGRFGDGWLFLVKRRTNGRQSAVSMARGIRVSDDMTSRLPVASGLKTKKVLLFGCGAIGSFAAIELARAGVGQLTIGDFDVVEPGNGVRWPLGRSAWGLKKTVALRDHLAINYPWSDVSIVNGRLGGAITETKSLPAKLQSPLGQLVELINEADVIIDTTASTECQHALAFHSARLGKPYIAGYATEGAVGGVVARLAPGRGGCLVCLQEHWTDGSLPLPPIDPTGTVLPIGCNAPTFTGGAFDLQEVSLEVVRSTIGFLAPEIYDPGNWSLSLLALTDNGRRTLPRWKPYDIPPHARCSCKDGA